MAFGLFGQLLKDFVVSTYGELIVGKVAKQPLPQ